MFTAMLLSAALFTPSAEPAPKVLASVQGRLVGDRTNNLGIYLTAEELKKAGGDEKKIAEQLKVDSLDFKKHTLIVLGVGPKPTGGYKVEVTSLEVKDDVLTIKWKADPPKGFVTQAFTNPAVTLLIDKFAGKIVFDPAPPKAANNDLKRPDVIRE